MKHPASPPQAVTRLLSSRRVAVLATHDHGQPYTSLVAFAATDDLKRLLFATPRATRKYANILADARVAMMIDNRSNKADDLREAVAVTAIGRVEEVERKPGSRHVKCLLAKHPDLEEFVTGADQALLTVIVDKYVVVSRFQQVKEYRV